VLPRASYIDVDPPFLGVYSIEDSQSSWICNGQNTSIAMNNNGGMCNTATWQAATQLSAADLNHDSKLARDGNFHVYATDQYGVSQYTWSSGTLNKTASFNITSRPKGI
jgi:hypothetical protein